jgi:hypothetical protein
MMYPSAIDNAFFFGANYGGKKRKAFCVRPDTKILRVCAGLHSTGERKMQKKKTVKGKVQSLAKEIERAIIEEIKRLLVKKRPARKAAKKVAKKATKATRKPGQKVTKRLVKKASRRVVKKTARRVAKKR